jgi:hypothetical protein
MRSAIPIVVLALSCASPAVALDVTFAGTVANTCSIALATPGVLALSGDGTILSTNNGGIAAPATVNVISIGVNTLSLAPPTLEDYPDEYTPGGEILELSTSGLLSNPIFTGLGIDGLIGLLPLTSLLVDLRITNPDGFAQGLYTAKSVLTCS